MIEPLRDPELLHIADKGAAASPGLRSNFRILLEHECRPSARGNRRRRLEARRPTARDKYINFHSSFMTRPGDVIEDSP